MAAQRRPLPPVRGHVLSSRSWRWVTEVRGSAHLAPSVWMLRHAHTPPSSQRDKSSCWKCLVDGRQRALSCTQPSLHGGVASNTVEARLQ